MEIDPLSVAAARFTHALYMVAALLPYTHDYSLPPVVRIACLEDWFTNYRILIEFVVLPAPKKSAKRSHARDLLGDWSATAANGANAAEVQAIARDHGLASNVVSHIGVYDPKGPVEDLGPEELRQKARSIISVAKILAGRLADADNDYAFTVTNALRLANGALATLPRSG